MHLPDGLSSTHFKIWKYYQNTSKAGQSNTESHRATKHSAVHEHADISMGGTHVSDSQVFLVLNARYAAQKWKETT